MEDDFDYGSAEDAKFSVARYEEMLRNQDQYFFDALAFEGIIDYYIEKNDPVKALQVVGFAVNQHPFASVFLLKEAQLHAMTGQFSEALQALDKAEMLEPSEGEIAMVKGGVLGSMGEYEQALFYLNKALSTAEHVDEVYLQIAMLHQHQGRFDDAINNLKLSLEHNMENQDALYELAYCYDELGRQDESVAFYKQYIDSELRMAKSMDNFNKSAYIAKKGGTSIGAIFAVIGIGFVLGLIVASL